MERRLTYRELGAAMAFTNTVLLHSAVINLLSSHSLLEKDPHEQPLTPAFHTLQNVGLRRHQIADFGRWKWRGVEIYGTDFRFLDATGRHSAPWFAGFAPSVSDSSAISFSSTPYRHDSRSAQRSLARHFSVGSWHVPLPTPIYQRRGYDLENWWQVKLPSGRHFWLRDSDDALFLEDPVRLHANAKAVLYRENKVASAAAGLEEIELRDLLDPSFLRNALFRILNCREQVKSLDVCGNYARSQRGFYDYPFESFEYSEMVGYYSIQRAMDWHLNIQSNEQKAFFSKFGLVGPIDVFVRAADSSGGGPFYAPVGSSVGSANPIIVVTTGDEFDDSNELRYLSKDSDVFFHEFTHHVLYRSVQPPAPRDGAVFVQPRALQEGLADYFTYAITGNNRLAESTDASGALRQGNAEGALPLELFDPPEIGNAYLIGDLISSTIWKLRQQLSVWQGEYNQIDKIVWDSFDLLPKAATLYQFACAVYVSAGNFEKENNVAAGSLTGPITAEFVARAFFESAVVAEGALCPNASTVLRDADILEDQDSVLPPVSGEKEPTEFTGASSAALPPFSGSLYIPQQSRKTWCGVVSLGGGTAAATGRVALVIPMLIAGAPWVAVMCRRRLRKRYGLGRKKS